ncbi:MAG: hypothetical protein M3Q07_09270 [Pseudobdellovibrionaceae bacterium]|nr:hypothetical protein [Pseudobdellovibrionaceae bacterium]
MKRLMMLCLIWTLIFAQEAMAGSPVNAEEASHPHADFSGIDLIKLSGLIPIHLGDLDKDFVDLAPGTVLYQQEDPEVPWRTIREKLETGAFRQDFPYLVNQPAVDSALWKAVMLRLDGDQPRTMILEHAYASHLFELVHISEESETHFPRNGTKRLNRGKRLLHRFPYEQIVLNPGLNLLLIKVQTQILSVSVNLHTEDHFMKRSSEGNLKMVCLMAGLLMVLIHNIASFITT